MRITGLPTQSSPTSGMYVPIDNGTTTQRHNYGAFVANTNNSISSLQSSKISASSFSFSLETLDTITAPAGSYSPQQTTTIQVPAGKSVCLIAIPCQLMNHNVYLWTWSFSPSTGEITYRIHNTSNSDVTVTPKAYCIFV